MMAAPTILAYIYQHCLHELCRQCRQDVGSFLFAIIAFAPVIVGSIVFCVGSVGNQAVNTYIQACLKDTRVHTHEKSTQQMPSLPTSNIITEWRLK